MYSLNKIKRGVSRIIDEDLLIEKLASNKQLVVKLGIDPTSPHVHLGFAVALRKLKMFQEMGHKAIIIVGDYTSTIGDPSYKNNTRPLLSFKEALNNTFKYKELFFKIIDPKLTTILYNSTWLSQMTLSDVSDIMRTISLSEMIKRDDFKARINSGNEISLHEVLYPVLQAYDSYKMSSDIEIGGMDQHYNIITGRELQKKLGKSPQCGILLPTLVGIDGNKMSKSSDNMICMDEEPISMYNKIMSLPNNLISSYFNLLTDISIEEISKNIEMMYKGDITGKELKRKLAHILISEYHDEEMANEVLEETKHV